MNLCNNLEELCGICGLCNVNMWLATPNRTSVILVLFINYSSIYLFILCFELAFIFVFILILVEVLVIIYIFYDR